MTLRQIYLNKLFWKRTLKLAVPIALQNLLAASFAMVDTFMVAGLGGTVLSAVGMATQLSWLMNGIMFGIVSGTSIFVSQYWGAGDRKAIHRTEGIALVFAAVFSALFCLFGYIFAEGIVGIYTDTPAVIAYGADYIRFACWSYIPNSLTFVLCAVLRSTESVKLPVIISGCNSILNVFLNYCLIGGHCGFPKMGAAGAALATSVSNWIMLFVLIAVCYFSRNICRAPLRDLFGFGIRHVKEFLSKTIPATANETIWALGTTVMNAILSNMGDDYYAGVTILRTIEDVAFVASIGLCNACCIMVGKNIGAGEIRAAKDDTVRFNLIMPIFTVAIGGMMLLLRHPIVSLFTMNGNYSQLAISSAIICLTVYASIMPGRNLPYLMIVGVFRPGGDAKTGMLVDLIPLWCIAIPITAILAYWVKLPFTLVFLFMYLLEDIPKAFMCIKHYLSEKWIRPVTEAGKAGYAKYLNEKKSLTK